MTAGTLRRTAAAGLLCAWLSAGCDEYAGQSCNSALYDTVDKRFVSTCFAECETQDGKPTRLRGYQEGFIPAGISALIGGP